MVAEISMAKREHKAAVRAAERARTLFRELGDEIGECASLFLVAQNSLCLARDEGAQMQGDPGERLSRGAKDALDKAVKMADASVKMARELLSDGTQDLLGACVACQGKVQMYLDKPDEALRCADEGVILFREISDLNSEGFALLLSADALRVTRSYQESKEAAQEALNLFNMVEETKGAELATELLGFIEQIEEQQWQPQEPQGGDEAVSVARVEREKTAALDVSA